jgi:hypothetical protein
MVQYETDCLQWFKLHRAVYRSVSERVLSVGVAEWKVCR